MRKISILLFAAAVLMAGCGGKGGLTITEKNAPEDISSYSGKDVINRINDIKNGATPKVKPSGEEADDKSAAESGAPPAQSQYQSRIKINEATKNMNTAVIKTNKGNITVKLNPGKAPLTVENFKRYINAGYYANTVFHRVIPDFMIQGGGFEESGAQKGTEAPIKIESDNGLKNDRGAIAMARTQEPNSATSQFFINLKDNDFLNYSAPNARGWGYAVFGQVVSGMDVVDEIAGAETGPKGAHQDWPKEDVIIESVSLEE